MFTQKSSHIVRLQTEKCVLVSLLQCYMFLSSWCGTVHGEKDLSIYHHTHLIYSGFSGGWLYWEIMAQEPTVTHISNHPG